MNESDEAAGIERRADPRATVRTEMKIFYPDLRHLADAICRDISVGGMFVESLAPLAVGTEIRFDLHFPTRRPQVVRGDGVVVWSRKGDLDAGKPGGFGVKFLQLDTRFRNLIFRVVDRFIQGGGDPFDLEPEI
jgi:uncharacterized protein (TIGR02266 family)